MSNSEQLWSQQYLDRSHGKHEAFSLRKRHNETASESLTWFTCLIIVGTSGLALFLMMR